jgi:alkanesulfonate monooxygenase
MARLRFHWSLSQVGDTFRRAKPTSEQTGLPNFDEQIDFCRRAEENGIESLLMAFGFTRPDPVVLSAALSVFTEKIKFMIACRSGVISPTTFVQQINTVSALNGGRVCVNIVMGHSPHELRYYGDFLEHDERCERTDEFLTICRAFWERRGEVNFRGEHYQIEGGKLSTPFVSAERQSPEIFLGGNSHLTERLAVEHASCLWRFPAPPESLRASVEPITSRGTEVGLLVSLIARRTREEALRAAASIIERAGEQSKEAHEEFAHKSDSVGFRSNYELAKNVASEWLTPYLWTGAIPYLGAPAIALVGSYAEIAQVIWDYKQIGVTQFLFMGWPDVDEMISFGREILPLVRAREEEEALSSSEGFAATPDFTLSGERR